MFQIRANFYKTSKNGAAKCANSDDSSRWQVCCGQGHI